MDVEGSEEEVLYSNPNILSKIKLIVIQIHPKRCNKNRVLLLLKKYYQFVYLIKEKGIQDQYFLNIRKGDKRNPRYLASSRRITSKMIKLLRV